MTTLGITPHSRKVTRRKSITSGKTTSFNIIKSYNILSLTTWTGFTHQKLLFLLTFFFYL